MTNILDPKMNWKWRKEAERCAVYLKTQGFVMNPMRLGFAFDDAFIKVSITQEEIYDKSVSELAEYLYQLILAAAQPKEKP